MVTLLELCGRGDCDVEQARRFFCNANAELLCVSMNCAVGDVKIQIKEIRVSEN